MGETPEIKEAKYLHGVWEKVSDIYGGHDPEDYQHTAGEEPTDLNLHQILLALILNNTLPAAKKKKKPDVL
jgi:hypothetical protein